MTISIAHKNVGELFASPKWDLRATKGFEGFEGNLNLATRERIKADFLPYVTSVVLDIETLGTRIDSEVIEIGILGLDAWGDVVFTWEALLQKTKGAFIDDATIEFHNVHSDLLDKWVKALETDRLAHVSLLVFDMFELLSSLKPDTLIWTYGLNFDYPLLQTMALRVGNNFQIRNYRNLRCLRTWHESMKMLGFAGHPDFNLNKTHAALADCFNEAFLVKELHNFTEMLANRDMI